MIIDFDWLAQDGIQDIINSVYKALDIIRIVVPIGLIVMTTLDVSKKVINPDDKDGQKKIMIRAIAALIVFLLPTIITLVKDVMNLNVDSTDPGNGGSGSTHIKTTPTPTPTVDPNTRLESLSLFNCPNEAKKIYKNDTINLTTDIPTSYIGDIKWSVVGDGKNSVSLRETSGGKSVQVSISSIKKDTTAKIVVEADGRQNVCNLNLAMDRLTSVDITNCPKDQDEYLVGSRYTLKTTIPNDFNREIRWSFINDEHFKIIGPNYKNELTIEFISEPVASAVYFVVSADGHSASCHINVKSFNNLQITNCPTNTMHIGDKFTLNTNIPDSYKGTISWTKSNETFKITESADQRSVDVEVIGYPYVNGIKLDNGVISIAARSAKESTTCKIPIE